MPHLFCAIGRWPESRYFLLLSAFVFVPRQKSVVTLPAVPLLRALPSRATRFKGKPSLACSSPAHRRIWATLTILVQFHLRALRNTRHLFFVFRSSIVPAQEPEPDVGIVLHEGNPGRR